MIYSDDYQIMAGQINSLTTVRYLKETGWRMLPMKRAAVKVFQIENEIGMFQATVPLEQSMRDYNEAMYEVIRTIAEVEKKAVEQVMLFLLNPNADIIKIRLEKKQVEAGNILVDDAIRLYENAKKLIAATALDVINPKAYHQGRTDDVVQKFLTECRFGQTQIGSYVTSIICPFAGVSERNEYYQLSIFSEEEECANSLTRKVTNKLMDNIDEIKNQIDNAEMEQLIEDTGISRNFYEALVSMNLESRDTVLEFATEWSPIVKENRTKVNNIRFSHDYFQPLNTIIEKKKVQKEKQTQIVGRVKALNSLPAADLRTSGLITIVYLDEQGKSKSINTKLGKADYDRAIEAHTYGKYVEIIGEIKGGKRPSIECQTFNIFD